MDRRTFLKVLGVTAASTAATSTLIALPETEPRIQLLAEKEIIVHPDDITIFPYVLSWRYKRNDNITMSQMMGRGDVFPSLGRIEAGVEVVVNLHDATGNIVLNDNRQHSVLRTIDDLNMYRVAFNHSELDNKVFIMMGFAEEPGNDGLLRAKITGRQVSADGFVI
ncbi:MAG: hypothetical protein JRJ45_00370 [Deltaproteobacteria bacterium]|nr:hypothetical protein [Deltaproteobacteria bacterium]